MYGLACGEHRSHAFAYLDRESIFMLDLHNYGGRSSCGFRMASECPPRASWVVDFPLQYGLACGLAGQFDLLHRVGQRICVSVVSGDGVDFSSLATDLPQRALRLASSYGGAVVSQSLQRTAHILVAGVWRELDFLLCGLS